MQGLAMRRWAAFGALAILLSVGACEEPPLDCADSLLREVPAFVGAAGALSDTTRRLRGQMAFACAGLAGALGVENPPVIDDPSRVSDGLVIDVCTLARGALEEAMVTSGPISVAVVGAVCDFAASDQVLCEEACARGDCEPESVEARCDPALTKGTCAADCTGTCIMDGGSVLCDGSCDGACKGNCSSACGAECTGPCDGVCTGECFGACADVVPGAICEGLCKGGCTAPYGEVTCEAPLAPTSCEIRAACIEACSAHALLGAACSLEIEVTGSDAMEAILEAFATPIYAAALLRGQPAIDEARFVAEEGYTRAYTAVYQAGCVYEMGVELLPTFDGARRDVESLQIAIDQAQLIVTLIQTGPML
jgi:hypothetical protein